MGVMGSFLRMNSEAAKKHVSAAALWTSEVSASSTRISNVLANPSSVTFWEAEADWSETHLQGALVRSERSSPRT